jgi:hypothetical protein
MTLPDPDTCHTCDKPIVCEICESCAEHCKTEAGPDACWQAIENYRQMLAPNYPAAAKPRWRS